MPLFTALFFGFLLGLRHALDADHIVAVSTIVSRHRSILRAIIVGMTAMTVRKTAPASVIRVMVRSRNSAVEVPGRMPGT